jgi:hypothetical protein
MRRPRPHRVEGPARTAGRRWLPLLFALWGCTVPLPAPGPAADGAVPAPDLASPMCRQQDGRVCDPALGCTTGGGCAWCGCTGDGQLSCLLVGCERARITCRSGADCPSGEACLFDPGCDGAPGTCYKSGYNHCRYIGGSGTRAGPVQGMVRVCGCDGVTADVPATCGAERPYRHVGTCP